MERFYILAPALIPLAYVLLMFAFFCIRSAIGYRPEIVGVNRRKFSDIIGPFLTTYFLWLIRPLERLLVASKVTPNTKIRDQAILKFWGDAVQNADHASKGLKPVKDQIAASRNVSEARAAHEVSPMLVA